MKRAFAFVAILATLAVLTGHAATALAEPLPITVSIAPQAYFAKRIGGDKVAVTVMVPAGADAHAFEPRPSQMAALHKARIYFAVGVDFENAWLPRFAQVNPRMTIVETDAGIDKIAMAPHHHESEPEAEHEAEHRAGGPGDPAGHGKDHDAARTGHDKDEDGHHHDGLDPHVWLSPVQAKVLAAAMRDALIAADAANAGSYRDGYQALAADMDALDARLAGIFAPVPESRRKFMVFHPAWGYLAKQYGLCQEAVEREGKEPGPAQLAAVIAEAKKDGIRVLFVQPQFSTRNAEVVAKAIDGRVVAVDPLAEDWLANMEKVAEAFSQAMK